MIGLLITIVEELLPYQLVKLLKGDITTAHCAYIKKDLMLLFKKKIEDITKKFELIHLDFASNLSEYRQRPPSKALEYVVNVKDYKDLATAVLSVIGTRSQMVMNYCKDFLTMLAVLTVIWTGNITQHRQAERQMLKYIFTFDHNSF